QVGDPKLPARTQLLEVPLGATVEIKILSSEYTDVNLSTKGFNNPLFPVQPSVRKSATEIPALVKNAAAYSKNTFNVRDIVDVFNLGIAKDRQFVQLNICPIQYLPSQNVIRVYHHIEFEVTYVGGQPKTIFSQKPLVFQIISHRAFESTLAPFITWKTEKGFDVRVRYTDDIGGTGATLRTNIKNYLQGIYNNPATRADFLLLVGDNTAIPAYSNVVTGYGSHVTDLYYAEYTGDNLPDIQYGRLSGASGSPIQIANQIEKILAMEKMNVPSLDFFNKTTFVAGSESGLWMRIANATVNYAANNYWIPANGAANTTVFLSSSNSSSTNGPGVRANLNEGRSLINYTAHCNFDRWDDNTILTTHIPNFTNENKYPLMIGNCCLSAKFEVANNVGTELVRAQRKGAVTYIGGSNNTYWYEDLQWALGTMTSAQTQNPENITITNTGWGVYDRQWHTQGQPRTDWAYTTSEIIFWGNMAVELGSATSPATKKLYYWEIYHVLGDPSYIQTVTTPQTLTVTHLDAITTSDLEFEIQTVPYAYVGFTMDGELIGGGMTDASGQFTLTFDDPLELGDAKLVITAKGYIPYITTVAVIPSNPNAPNAVTSLTATPGANGALTAAINWTNPTTNLDNVPLTSLTAVNIYVNGEATPVHTISNPTVGGAGTWTYTATTSGSYRFKVAAVNTAGEGRPVNSTLVWIGHDVPAAPANVVLAKNDMTASLSWDAPTAGLNGGHFTTGLVYDVFRMPGNTQVATGQTTRTFSEIIGIPGEFSYRVVAKNIAGEGGNATSNTAFFCPLVTVFPWNEGFENNGTNFPVCWTQEQVTGNVDWAVITSSTGTPTAAPNGGSHKARMLNTARTGDKTKLIPPAFDLSGIDEPVLKFWHAQAVWSGDQDRLRVFYKASASDAWTLLQEYTTSITTWTERSIPLPNPSSDYYIAFEGEVSWGYGVHLDNISITGVQKPAGAIVATPVLDDVIGITRNSITILPVTAPTNGQTVEYSISPVAAPASNWQDGLTFSGLNHSTTYYIFARSKANTNFAAGAASEPLVAATSIAYTVNITVPTNGTITVMAGSEEIFCGAELDENVELALIATAHEGYRFVEWWHGGTDAAHVHVLDDHIIISATFELAVSIVVPTDEGTLTVYPNPVSDMLHIQTEQVIKQIFVLDMTGKVMMQLQGNRKTIDLQDIPTGNYIVRIHTATEVVPVKIIKQ
ncbi:MAG: C25 family cysteine peptidase, partial [Bacteroidales bacterium]|nr:C25 family cysteine peptidase [Bacteroidales bacterium]